MTANIGEWRSANGMSYKDSIARIQKNQANGVGGSSNDYDQSAYLSELNQRVKANVIPGVWNGQSPFGSSQGYTVMVHPDFLQMMHGDPELGAYYEEQMNILAEYGADFKQREEAKGHTIHSQGTYINQNGEMSSYVSFTMKSEGSGGNGGNVKTGKKTKSAKELMQELQQKLEEEKKTGKSGRKTRRCKSTARIPQCQDYSNSRQNGGGGNRQITEPFTRLCQWPYPFILQPIPEDRLQFFYTWSGVVLRE